MIINSWALQYDFIQSTIQHLLSFVAEIQFILPVFKNGKHFSCIENTARVTKI